MTHHVWQNEKCIQCNAKSSKQNLEYGYNYNNICACMGKNGKEVCIPKTHISLKKSEL